MSDTEWIDTNDPNRTIPEKTVDGAAVEDFRKLRETFHIYPGEDGCKYQNLKLIGMGGMGVVFSGEDPTLERRVAVKVLREPYRHNQEQIAKFINEARITARIDHPNVVAVHQLGVNEHQGVYFSMRHIGGETLQHAIRHLHDGDKDALQHYTPRRLLDIFIAGCNGVAAAHEKKILHCDLKPDNIMIGKFGEVLVLDWGLARDFDSPAVNTGNIAGTPAFMAPELVSGMCDKPDEKTEVYALGTILYSILTWRQAPFDMRMDKKQLLYRIASGKHLPLHAPKGQVLPRELAAICLKAMNCDREKRYATVTELLNDLYNYRDGRAVKAYSPNLAYRFFKLCLRHPAIPLAVLVAVVTIALYSGAELLIDYAQDRSILQTAASNEQIAENYYHSAINLFYRENDPLADDLRPLIAAERNQKVVAELATIEYSAIVDAASGLSPAGLKDFIRQYGSRIFVRMLTLRAFFGDDSELKNFLELYRRRPVFDLACQSDSKLARMVELIDKKCGSVVLHSGSAGSIRIIMPDGVVRREEISGSVTLELPAGKNIITTDSGVTVQLLVVAGQLQSFLIPEVPEDDKWVIIPEDYCRLEVPGVENGVWCRLPEFLIFREPLPGVYSIEAAEKILKDNPSYRLPTALQWQKIITPFPGKMDSLYGVKSPGSLPVMLAGGKFFDPVTGKISFEVPSGGALLYPVLGQDTREND